MQIFYLDQDPKKAAEYLDDKRVVKMITETAQLLSNAVRLNGMNDGYLLTHTTHPCTIWVSQNRENFEWLCEYEFHLYNEYKKRYQKEIHQGALIGLSMSQYVDQIPKKNFYDPPQVMPDKYKSTNTVQSYRNFFINEKLPADYSTEIPYWLKFLVEK